MGQYSRAKASEIIYQILKELSSILFEQVFIAIHTDSTTLAYVEEVSILFKQVFIAIRD